MRCVYFYQQIMKKIITLLFLISATAASNLLYAATSDKDGDFVVCVNDNNPPFSSLVEKENNIDIQVLELISQKISKNLRVQWTTIPNRGGIGKVLKTSIGEGLCDAYIGLPTDSAFLDELKEKKLAISKPYFKVGYFLIGRKHLTVEKNQFDTSKKVGTVTRTSGDLFIHKNFPKNRYPFNTYAELLDALNKDTVDYALVWSPAIARHQEKISTEEYRFTDYQPENMTMNMSFGIATKETQITLINQINLAIDSLLNDGSLNNIVNQSKLPFVKLPQR